MRVHRAIGILLALCAASAVAQEPASDDLARLIAAVWEERQDEFTTTSRLEAHAAPVRDAAGRWICPTHRVPMRERVVEKKIAEAEEDDPQVIARLIVAAFSPPGRSIYFRFEIAGEEPYWTGPFSDDRLPVPTKPPATPTEEEEPALTRESVVKALQRHVTDSGDQGFFDERFGNLTELGPGVVDHLFTIFETADDAQMQHLAIEAIGEIADKAAVERLDRLRLDPRYQRYGLSIAVTLHQLGNAGPIETIVADLTAMLEQNPSQRSAIHAQLGLIHSRIRREDTALGHYQRAVELDPANQIAHYNLACSLSKLGRIDDALASLEDAMKSGYDDWEWMMVDGDLEAIRTAPRFQELFLKYR